MSDDCIPDLIDVSVNNSKNKADDKNETLKRDDSDDFKLIVSKRKRREQNKMDSNEASTSAATADDDMEDECDDIEDEEAELDKLDKIQNEELQIKKLKFPPISAEKLMVLIEECIQNTFLVQMY